MKGHGAQSEEFSVLLAFQSSTLSGDYVTLTKVASTAESSLSAVILYPEEYSCSMQKVSNDYANLKLEFFFLHVFAELFCKDLSSPI